jgi:ADP-ribose pyrophosphatase YjhB (NUDIX family)
MIENFLAASARAALAGLVTDDPQLRARRAELQLHLQRKPKPFDRGTARHITVTALVYRADLDALLMIDHLKLQRQLYPGGHVEESDVSLMAAAARECLEETGLNPMLASAAIPELFDIDVHDIPGSEKEPTHTHLDIRYLYRVNPLGPPSHGRWVARSEIAESLPEPLARPARWLEPTSKGQ